MQPCCFQVEQENKFGKVIKIPQKEEFIEMVDTLRKCC